MRVKTIRIALAGGGSGGHVYPLIAVAETLNQYAKDHGILIDLRYLGTARPYRELFARHEVRCHTLTEAKFRRYASFQNVLDIPKFLWSICEAICKLYVIMPDVIFSKGGPGAFPVVLAGWWYRIPVIIHESDAVPGMANALSARFARKIAVSFREAAVYFPVQKTVMVGGLVRPSLYAGDVPQREAKEKFGFAPDRPMLLVLGGSLGSKTINEFVVKNLVATLGYVQILHQTGLQNYDAVKQVTDTLVPQDATQPRSYRCVPYFADDYGTALAAADCVLGRAGSGVIFEALAFGKPLLLIPLAGSANDHQRKNAQIVFVEGAARIIEENNLTPSIFANEVKPLLTPEAKEGARKAAEAHAGRSGAALLTEELLALAGVR